MSAIDRVHVGTRYRAVPDGPEIACTQLSEVASGIAPRVPGKMQERHGCELPAAGRKIPRPTTKLLQESVIEDGPCYMIHDASFTRCAGGGRDTELKKRRHAASRRETHAHLQGPAAAHAGVSAI